MEIGNNRQIGGIATNITLLSRALIEFNIVFNVILNFVYYIKRYIQLYMVFNIFLMQIFRAF